MPNLPETISDNIRTALQEDLGEGDITAQLIPADKQLAVSLLCRENAILCGVEWFNEAFRQLDTGIRIDWFAADGDQLRPGKAVCEISGHARPILSAERTALNFLQTLSATATATHRCASIIAQTRCRILDTRKTIPGLRLGQKYAVKCGGGDNHRIGLFDAFLLKENHLAAAGSMAAAVAMARKLRPGTLVEVEVENLDQLHEAIQVQADRALLDNFTAEDMRRAVDLTRGRLQLEASGNITEQNLLQVAQTGIDFISIGALTKHIQAIDFSLRFIE